MELRKIGVLALAVLLAAGCAKKSEFSVTGKLEGGNRDSLFIEEVTAKALETRKVILTGEDGSFSFSDTASNPRLLFIRTADKEYIMLMVLGGEQIRVNAEKGNVNRTLSVSGSPQSELVLELNRETVRATTILDSLGAQYESLLGKGNDSDAEVWIQREFGKMMDEQQAYIKSFIEKHTADPASLLALSHQLGKQPVLNPANDFKLFDQVDAQLYKKYPTSELVLKIHKYVEALRPQYGEGGTMAQIKGIGMIAIDIALPDPDGKEIKLSSLRGKVVLLDFWAAWCAPCRRENPNLVAAYAKYHDKGFEIYQVSLDKTREDWVAAIEKDGLNWIHVSDLKYWNSPVARQYGIQSIPSNFLLDTNGKIIARDLRGPALEEELAKLLR